MARNPPPDVIASWPPPNYVNPESRGPTLVRVEITFAALMVLFVAQRLYTRCFIVRSWGVDDWLIIPAFIFSICLTTSTCLSVLSYGWGVHIWDLHVEILENSRKLVMITTMCFATSIILTKLSILAFYLRLAPTRWFRRASFIGIAFVALWWIQTLLLVLLQCIPLKAYWSLEQDPNAKCIDETAAHVAFAVVDIFTDCFIFILPLPIIAKLQLPRPQKIGLLVLFILGALTIIASTLRIPSVLRTAPSYDLTWEAYDLAIWTAIESNVAIMCACFPSLKPFLERVAPRLLGRLSSHQPSRPTFYGGNSNMNMHRELSKKYSSDYIREADELSKQPHGVVRAYSLSSMASQYRRHDRKWSRASSIANSEVSLANSMMGVIAADAARIMIPENVAGGVVWKTTEIEVTISEDLQRRPVTGKNRGYPMAL